jgi:hypothetical protein
MLLLRCDLLDSRGRRPFFRDGPVASRDIHDGSALRRSVGQSITVAWSVMTAGPALGAFAL